MQFSSGQRQQHRLRRSPANSSAVDDPRRQTYLKNPKKERKAGFSCVRFSPKVNRRIDESVIRKLLTRGNFAKKGNCCPREVWCEAIDCGRVVRQLTFVETEEPRPL
ncbi:hypothetical protein ANTQUA_LOCUS3498 [Anthophora quadrimaculata]